MKKTIFSIMFAMIMGMMIGSCQKAAPVIGANEVDSTTVDSTVVDSTVVDSVVVDTTVVDTAIVG